MIFGVKQKLLEGNTYTRMRLLFLDRLLTERKIYFGSIKEIGH